MTRPMAAVFGKWHTGKIGAAWVVVSLLFCLSIFQAAAVRAAPLIGTEYDVKTGFIYNFANFVSWPPAAFGDKSDELVLCFVSDSPAADALFKLNGQSIRGRKIKVVSYTQESCLDASHILYFATQDKNLIQKLIDLARERSILTIGETEGFSQMGGIINFFEEGNRLRFKINVDAAKRAGLTMSSQLLGSAQIYREEQK
ncbi:MAG: YfiR family protein [Desulfobacterales bacterium]